MRDVVESLTCIPNQTDNFSEVYWVVQRENGRMIEKMVRRLNDIDCEGSRQIRIDEQVFMDSTISYDTPIDVDSITDNGDGTALVEITDNPFSSGDTIVLSCAEGFDGSFDVVSYAPIINYWPLSGSVNTPAWGYASSQSEAEQACYDCDITKMIVRLDSAPGVGKTRKFTLLKNAVATSISITISGTDTTGTVTGSVNFGTSYFDKISLKEEIISGATQSAFSLSLLAETSIDRQVIVTGRRIPSNPTTPGNSIPIMNNPAAPWGGSALVDFYQLLSRYSSLISSAGTLKNYRQIVDGSPHDYNAVVVDNTKYLTFELNVYAHDLVGGATSLDFHIGGTSTSGDSGVKTKAVTAGQMGLFFVNTNTGDLLNFSYAGHHTLDFIPTVAGSRIYDCVLNVANGTTKYTSGIGTSINGDSATTEQYIVAVTSGTVKNLYVDLMNVSPGAGKSITITVRKNGVDSSLAVAITNTTQTGNDTSNSFTVVAGDLISIKGTTDSANFNSGSKGPKIGWTFVADNPLETPIFLSSWGEAVSPNSPTVDTNVFQIVHNRNGVESVNGGIARLAEGIFTGLDHLEGEYVSILADGVSLPGATVVGGSVTASTAAGIVHIGLPYFSDLCTLDINITNDLDTTMARKIKCGNVNIGFTSSHGGWIGDNEDEIYEAYTDIIIGQNRADLETNEELTTMNVSTVLYDGIIRRPLNAKWKHGANVFFRQKSPIPVQIVSIEPEVSIGGPI